MLDRLLALFVSTARRAKVEKG